MNVHILICFWYNFGKAPLLILIFKGWLKKRPQKEADVFRTAFNKVYDDVHSFVQQKLPAKMKLLEAIYIRYLIILMFNYFLIEYFYTDEYASKKYIFISDSVSTYWWDCCKLKYRAVVSISEYILYNPTKNVIETFCHIIYKYYFYA